MQNEPGPFQAWLRASGKPRLRKPPQVTIRISVHVQPLKNRIVLKKRKARDSRQAYTSDEEDDTAFRQPSKVGHVPSAMSVRFHVSDKNTRV
jgi:hypothetical protein